MSAEALMHNGLSEWKEQTTPIYSSYMSVALLTFVPFFIYFEMMYLSYTLNMVNKDTYYERII